MKRFPHYIQLDAMDCGPSCLRMIAKYYGKTYSLQTLRARSFITREGVSMLGISDAAEFIGFRTSGVRITFKVGSINSIFYFLHKAAEPFNCLEQDNLA